MLQPAYVLNVRLGGENGNPCRHLNHVTFFLKRIIGILAGLFL